MLKLSTLIKYRLNWRSIIMMIKINVLLISETTLNCFTQDVKLKEKNQ